MTIHEAIEVKHRLYEIWVSADRQYDFNRTHASMLQDFRYRRNKPEFANVVSEIRGQFVALGKARKVLVE